MNSWPAIIKDLNEVQGRILRQRPLPSIGEAFTEVRREASRRRVMLGGKKDSHFTSSGERPSETIALDTKTIKFVENRRTTNAMDDLSLEQG